MHYATCAVHKSADKLHTDDSVSSKAPFTDVYQAISFYNHHNPARMKAINLLEREGSSCGDDHQDKTVLWSYLCLVMFMRTLKPLRETLAYEAFTRWFLVTREEKTKSFATKDDLANYLRVHPRTLRRHLTKALVCLEKELRHAGLIETWGNV